MITSFHLETGYLSNFSPSPLRVNGLSFDTLEHAYQAYKATNSEDRESIRTSPTPGIAKRRGRSIKQNPTFQGRKVDIMLSLLRKKFSDPTLRAKLTSTGSEELIEGNKWHDNFWGNCHCPQCGKITGENKLGKLLMQVRGEP